MKFKNTKVTAISYSNISIEWDYKSYDGVSPINYKIRIYVSGSDTGPFAPLSVLGANNVSFIHIREKKRWNEQYYKLEIYGEHDDTIYDSVVTSIKSPKDLLVNRAREKYNLYLKRRAKNPVTFYKKKKTGKKCKCSGKDIFNCPICFDTKYGNDSLLGLESIYFDGFLKVNTDGYLEFFHRNSLYNRFAPVDNQTGGLKMSEYDYGIHEGDEFRIETPTGDPIFSFPILEVKTNSIIMQYNGENFYDSLQNCKFSVYRLKEVKELTKLETKVISKNTINIYDDRIDLSLAHKKIKFLDADENPLTEFEILNINTGIELDIIGGNTGFIRLASKFILFDASDVVTGYFDINSLIFSEDKNTYIKLENSSYTENNRIYILYRYDGNNQFIIDSIRHTISDQTNPSDGLMLLNITEVESAGVYKVSISTLGYYDYILGDEITQKVYDEIVTHIFSYDFKYSVFATSIGYAQQQMQARVTGDNMKISLAHDHILKTGFAGCGVIMTHLQYGKTYKGLDYNESEDSFSGTYDFYVDFNNMSIDTLNLPEGIYEIAYIYEVRDIKFKNYILPISPKLNNKEIEEVDGWYIRSEYLKNIKIQENNVCYILGDSAQYVFKIKSYNPYGVMTLENNIDPNYMYASLDTKSVFSIDFKNSGGYYEPTNGWIAYSTPTKKEETISPVGITTDLYSEGIIGNYPTIEPGDILFDSVLNRFYTVIRVDPRYFRNQSIYQIVSLKEKQPDEQDMLFGLLDR